MANYYPVNLLLKSKKCVVLGAGVVAQRKVKRLLESKAKVLVIGPKAASAIHRLSKDKKIVLRKRNAVLKDVRGAYLVIAATDDRRFNASAAAFCRKHGILVNVADSPRDCSFTLPAIFRRGSLTIAISTDGASPALAKKIRQDLAKKFGPRYALTLRRLAKLRPQIMRQIPSAKKRRAIFKKALCSYSIS